MWEGVLVLSCISFALVLCIWWWTGDATNSAEQSCQRHRPALQVCEGKAREGAASLTFDLFALVTTRGYQRHQWKRALGQLASDIQRVNSYDIAGA